MNKKRRIILRAETFERITLRKTSKIINSQNLNFGDYKIKISRTDPEGEQIILEAQILGSLEIKETNEEVRFVCRKN